MQQYDITVTNQQAFVVNAAGRYIKYLAGNNGGGDVSLTVSPGNAGATKTVLVPGQALRIGQSSATPSSWTLQNTAGGATITGKIVIGDGQIDDPTINGTVQVVDGGKARSLAGTAFSAGGSSGAGVAGQYGQIQLWNPATSGKRLVVESMLIWTTNTATILFESSTAQLASLGEYGQPKMLGAAPSVASINSANSATVPPSGNAIFWLPMSAGQTQTITPHEPYVIPPGYGLVMASGGANNGIVGGFEWYEEPNV